ncbi:insulin-like growth factor 2 mRNA-binding protein 3-A [Cylas formicarius]|uniref:insulin-like growth factor 2 mRNA-binding protein 3-A n=1 Tax=Cylas formicarius TaxID=197179 RepID=UPI002958ACCD|nr:insulin-like growth factor 2 mRNA-binding protein 3-A [Cylas formicarius]
MASTKMPPITMNKLYVGNLPTETNENSLRQLFLEQNLACTSVLVKRGGYAFVDCPDQSSADKAIDKLNGFNFRGSPLVVEPSVASGKRRPLPERVPVPVSWMRAGYR